ncbi:elongator complex protein 3 [Senegalimassilia anaerobia]|uniref:elongator complex protein 3 n=1 Tax=Senegalimassilia anaerobia TaxID=1473216 RepID=UPI003A93065C
MEKTLHNILGEIRRTNAPLAPDALDRIIRARNREVAGPVRYVAKKKLLPFYQEEKEHRPEHWRTWGVSPAEEALLVRTLQVKPRRTASGVATVTVLTKPWPCSSACLYCPNDVRMPKSYLHDEPACQRAERNWFDPYLQVTARLRTLHQMGHVTDKVELIVLGGTWSDYPEAYQIWYMHELFRALNDMGCETAVERESETRRKQYRDAGIACERDDLANWAAEAQARVTAGDASYNETVRNLYACGTHADGNGWAAAAQWQTATFSQLEALQRENESAEHRCVGLVVETRPDAVTPNRLATLRRLGCTKLQMGIQSLDERILAANHRGIGVDRMQQAFELARIFGFKTHAHFMTNLLGATPESDAADYRRMVEHPAFKPDEIKLYPCALVDGTGLVAHWRDGSWRPYTEQELVNLLAEDVLVTPPFTRISRMIRDISAHDIMTGNKKVNLRQLVDLELAKRAQPVQEIRSREIAFGAAANDELSLSEVAYETTNTHEVFLQWVTPDNRIAGFLRLSMPNADYANAHATDLPINAGEAMIREVHVYGRVAGLHQGGENAQHRGLGRMLIERACDIARENGYTAINVISAIGTRGYYRKQGFTDNGLYQQRSL